MSRLIQERRDMEAKFQEDMLAKKEEFHKTLEDIYNVDAEEYNNLKVRLETDMQTLEQHHATMQAIILSYIFLVRNTLLMLNIFEVFLLHKQILCNFYCRLYINPIQKNWNTTI